MRAELQRMGLSLDWEREFATCDPDYYGHQQKLFLDFLRAGLVERKESWVNWDPVDGTVLANEQVIDGRGWRSGAPVEKKQLSQWFLSITDYAQELLDGAGDAGSLARAGAADAGELDRPQRGRAADASRWPQPEDGIADVEVYTTRPDTLFGMSFLALAPDHPLAAAVAARDPGRGRVHRRMPQHGHQRGGDRDGREARLRHRPARAATRSDGRAACRSGSPISC